jgi:hypothetical protein
MSIAASFTIANSGNRPTVQQITRKRKYEITAPMEYHLSFKRGKS